MMKKINFINVLSLKEQRSLALWYTLSVGASILLCISLAIVQLMQVYHFIQLKRESARNFSTKTMVQAKTTHHDALMKKKFELESQVTALKNKNLQPSIFTLYTIFTSALKPTISLRTLRIHKDIVTSTLVCKQPKDALNFVRTLNKNHLFTHVKLTNLQTHHEPKSSHVQATIVATLYKKERST